MNASQPPADEQPLRSERFPAQGPIEIEVSISAGYIALHIGEQHAPEGAGEATVEIAHAPSARAPWADGMNAVLDWVGENFAEQLGTNPRSSPADALAKTRIEQIGNRLVIAGPTSLPARNVPLDVRVAAPAHSHVSTRTSTGDVEIIGSAERVDVATGSGSVTASEVGDSSNVRTGSGSVRLGAAANGFNVRTGSGDVEIVTLSGSAGVVTGTGAVWIGRSSGETFVRTGSGNIAVADARSGSVELNTGSGDLRIGIGTGVLAAVDVSSGAGGVVSELDVTDEPPEHDAPLTVHARTGSGNAVVRKSNA